MADDESGAVKEPLIPEPAKEAPAKKEPSARPLSESVRTKTLKKAFKAKKAKLTWKQWFIKNWVYVLCAAIFVAGVITIVALIVKPCEKETFMDIKNVKCNDLCAFSIPQNMTQKVNEVDSALLGNGTLFEEAGCSTIDCARRFCKHVEGV